MHYPPPLVQWPNSTELHVKNVRAQYCLPQIENNSRKCVQNLCRIEGVTQTLRHRCMYLQAGHLWLLDGSVRWAPLWQHTHTHTSNPVATHSLPAWSHVWTIDPRGPGATTRGEMKWVEGDRKCLQLGLAPMHSLSITLSHHLVFARKKRFNVFLWHRLPGLMNPPVLQLFIWSDTFFFFVVYSSGSKVCIYCHTRGYRREL